MTARAPGPLLGLLVACLLATAARGQDRLFVLDGPVGHSGLGYAVTGIDDVDGDGVGDVLVGTLACTSVNGGFARVYSGATGVVLREHSGDQPGCFGMAVTRLDDLTADGVDDYAIAAVREDSAWALQAGRVYVHSGADGGVVRVLEGPQSGARFGIGLSGLGDLDGDGVGELLVGSPWAVTANGTTGAVDVFSGATGLPLHYVEGDAHDDQFGYAVAGLDDLDRDGRPDFAVGAPIRWYGGTGAEPEGYVRVFSGADATELDTLRGVAPADHYGTSVAAVPDLDGDGVGEFAVGAPRRQGAAGDGTPERLGWLEVRSGLTRAVHFSSVGAPESMYGTSVRPLDDLDGDGLAEVLVGACYCQNNQWLSPGAGWFEIRSGADGSLLAAVHDGKPGQSFAFALAGLGDVTGDGVPDLVTGNTFDDAHGAQTGSAWIYSGADLALTLDVHAQSVAAGGTTVFGLDAGAGHAGDTYVVLGSVSGTSPGLPLGGGLVLPLNPDAYFDLTFLTPLPGVHGAFLGALDGAGRATASFALAPGLAPPAAVGLVLHHAFAVLDGGVAFTSNAVPVTLEP